MKLAVSSRGWSRMSQVEFLSTAAEMGLKGVELYNIHKDGLRDPARFRKVLTEYRASLVCLYTSCEITGSDEDLDVIRMNMRVARDNRVPFVAVCAKHGTDEDAARGLSKLLSENNGITLLIETKGLYSDTKRLRSLLDGFASDEIGALWDAHHTCCDTGEDPADTIEHLGAYIRHVHLHDIDEKGEPVFMGEGVFPTEDVVRALASVDYEGFISLEWKPEWQPEMDDPEVIFPQFVSYMHRFERTETGKRLYPNHDGTGQYIWKKDELIDLTFPRVLDKVVEEFPDQLAFRYTTLDYTRTYEEFRHDVDDFARALVSLGVTPGKKVSIWATNVPAWYIAFWSVTKIGAVLVSVNTAYRVHEAEYLLRQSDTHTLIMVAGSKDSDYREIMRELCPELETNKPGEPLHAKRLPFLRNVITVDFRMTGCLTFEEAFARKDLVPHSEILSMASRVRPSDVCNMQYTSGTTGFPKGVMLTHYNVVNNGKCIGDRMGLSTADRMMIQVPMFHCFGMVLSMTASMTHGATMCPMPYFSAKASLACVDKEKITCFNGVPTMFIAMFNHPDYRKTDFSHMRTGIMAGAGCPPDLMRRAARPDEMNMRGIVSVYGQTESSPGSTMSAWTDPEDVRCDTVGYAFPHVECKVIDPETGRELGPGENGEFCSRGYNTMKGYYKMSRATKETVDSEGWLHSGDIACRDENGNYRITGRLKDMIIRGGENLYPREIEEFIYTHPAVSDVQVVAVPDERYGEEAAALIILKDGQSVTEEEMRAFITHSLARHKVPRYIFFRDSFPMNAAGKILKYKLREEAAEMAKEVNGAK